MGGWAAAGEAIQRRGSGAVLKEGSNSTIGYRPGGCSQGRERPQKGCSGGDRSRAKLEGWGWALLRVILVTLTFGFMMVQGWGAWCCCRRWKCRDGQSVRNKVRRISRRSVRAMRRSVKYVTPGGCCGAYLGGADRRDVERCVERRWIGQRRDRRWKGIVGVRRGRRRMRLRLKRTRGGDQRERAHDEREERSGQVSWGVWRRIGSCAGGERFHY